MCSGDSECNENYGTFEYALMILQSYLVLPCAVLREPDCELSMITFPLPSLLFLLFVRRESEEEGGR